MATDERTNWSDLDKFQANLGARFVDDPGSLMKVASCEACKTLPWRPYVDLTVGDIKGLGKKMVSLLRHRMPADEVHQDGWVSIHALEHELGFRHCHELYEHIVREDTKNRMVLSPNFIRATNGHSLQFDRSEQCFAPYQDAMFHVTTSDKLVSIALTGLKRMGRQDVNLLPGHYSGCGWETRFPHHQKHPHFDPLRGWYQPGQTISVAIEVRHWHAFAEHGVNFVETTNGVVLADSDIPPCCLGFPEPIHLPPVSKPGWGSPRFWKLDNQFNPIPNWSTLNCDRAPMEVSDYTDAYEKCVRSQDPEHQ